MSECQLHEIDVELFSEADALLYMCKGNLSSQSRTVSGLHSDSDAWILPTSCLKQPAPFLLLNALFTPFAGVLS